MDGKHFPVSEMQPGVTAPPFHPNCRTDTCPYFDDMDEAKRAARDENDQGYELVPANMTYQKWEKQFVQKETVENAAESGIIKARFESPELLKKHFEKHKEVFGNITEEDYLERANQLLQETLSEDVEEVTRSDGSVSRYKFSTNEFLVITKDGKLRTYFKPVDGADYWRYEHERN